MKIIDISLRIEPGMLVYPGDPRFDTRPVSAFSLGNDCEVSELTIGTHCGTHIDAPVHMIPGGKPLDSMPLEHFIGPCRVLTLPHTVISEKMLLDAQIQPGERILLRTDIQGAALSQARFNPAALSPEAAQHLARLGVLLVGIDSPSIEDVEQHGGQVHRTLLEVGVSILEGLDLSKAEGERYFLSALPLSLVGENGSPCRAVLIEE